MAMTGFACPPIVCPSCMRPAVGAAFPYRSAFTGAVFAYVRGSDCRLVYIDLVSGSRLLERMYATSDYHDEFYDGDGQGT